MGHTVICGLYGCAIFLSCKGYDFRKKRLLNVKCVFLFSLQLCSETFLIIRKIQGDIINVYRSACKVSFVLSYFNEA